MKKISTSMLLMASLASTTYAFADDVPLDGQWRGDGGAALSESSGNTNSSSLILTAASTRQTADDKLSIHGQMLESRAQSNGVTNTTANQWLAGTRYDDNISTSMFGFGGLDFNHDAIKDLSLRSVISTGLGYHFVKTADAYWDVYGGADYRVDQYGGVGVSVNNQIVTRFNATELMLGEESSNKLSDSTSFKQSLVLNPNLSVGGAVRATFQAGLSVAMSKTLSLNVTLQDRYDSLTESPLKKNDILFFTGINVKFGS